MKLPSPKSLDKLYVDAMFGKVDLNGTNKYPNQQFTSLNAQKKAVKDLSVNMRFHITSEFEELLWQEDTSVWQVLSYMLRTYKKKTKCNAWEYIVENDEFCIKEIYNYNVKSSLIYGIYLDFLPALKKKSKKVFLLVATCLSALENEKNVVVNDPEITSRYFDTLNMNQDNVKDESEAKALKKEIKDAEKMDKLTSQIQNMKSTKADILNLLPGIDRKNALGRYFISFAKKVVDILDEPYDMEFFDTVSFNAEFDELECQETGFPAFISQYMKFIWNDSMLAWIEEEMNCYANEFGQVMPVDCFMINKKTKERINYGNFIGKLAKFMTKYSEDRQHINELITSPNLINIL